MKLVPQVSVFMSCGFCRAQLAPIPPICLSHSTSLTTGCVSPVTIWGNRWAQGPQRDKDGVKRECRGVEDRETGRWRVSERVVSSGSQTACESRLLLQCTSLGLQGDPWAFRLPETHTHSYIKHVDCHIYTLSCRESESCQLSHS
jgi:hypothetical protein